MFLAGLETSLDDLKYNADKAVFFGLATFVVPMLLGTVAMSLLGYGFLAAVLACIIHEQAKGKITFQV
jgi:Kef-type K+ transport system membrane component KefB